MQAVPAYAKINGVNIYVSQLSATLCWPRWPRSRTELYGPHSFRVAAPQICRLILTTETLAVNSSNQALRLGSLCKPIHRSRRWKILFKRCFRL